MHGNGSPVSANYPPSSRCMFLYYIRLGLRSLRRNPVLTILMMLSIGFGVAASITSYAVLRVTSTNPIPQKSDQLFAVQIDNSGPKTHFRGEPADSLSYIDAMALLDANKAQHQTALYPVELSVIPDDPSGIPFSARAYAAYSSTFKMFEIPFIYGQSWGASEDQNRASVAVISRSVNDKLFKGGNSVGRTIHLDGRSYTIVGVMDTWNPQPLYRSRVQLWRSHRAVYSIYLRDQYKAAFRRRRELR